MEIPLIPNWESQVPRNRVYKQGPKERQIIDDCFDKLHKQGRMGWATGHTPSGYPAFVVYRMVRNPDGSTTKKERVVIDLRGVNKVSEPDIYPLPTQDEVLQLLQAKYFISVVDARKMFHQWPIKREHRNRLAVISHRGQEVFNVALMGFINSVPYVQRRMELELKDLADFCQVYIDDIVIASETFTDHLLHLELVFS